MGEMAEYYNLADLYNDLSLQYSDQGNDDRNDDPPDRLFQPGYDRSGFYHDKKETTMLKKKKKAVKPKKVSDKTRVRQLTAELAAEHEMHLSCQRVADDYRNKCAELRVLEFRWKTSDGRTLKPTEMDEQHLRNTISYVQRTLVHKIGSSRYLQPLGYLGRAFYELLEESKRRGFDV